MSGRQKGKLMFPFITETANPIGGECYNCKYCYIHGSRGMKIRFKRMKNKYSGDMKLYEQVLDKRYGENDFVFFCDCIDYLHPKVPTNWIRIIFEWIEKSPRTKFLSLTKNPARYLDLKSEIPVNMYLGCTIESDIAYPELSNAPAQNERLKLMADLANDVSTFQHKKVLSIEPILKFTGVEYWFYTAISFTLPDIIVIGYDNHNYKLPEPSLEETNKLIRYLERLRYYNREPDKPKIVLKTIRKAWWEK